jgi:hypothetical protein
MPTWGHDDTSVAILAQAYLASSFAPLPVAAHKLFFPALTPPCDLQDRWKNAWGACTVAYAIYQVIVPIIVYDDLV